MKFILVEYDASWGKGILEDSKAFFYTVVITTISWIGVTLITPKETDNTLNNFISQTRPNGLWNGKIIGKDILVKNLVSWAVAIALGYSILFGIGFLVFKEWISFIPAFLITLVSILILRRNIVG
jgi:hypothetical protein